VGPLLEAIAILRRESPVPVIGFAGAPFTMAAYLIEGRAPRDLQQTKDLLHREPATFATLLDRLVDLDIAYLRAQVAAGAQAIQVFDSWVGSLSPFDYRNSVLPHMRRLFGELADLDVPTLHFGTGTAGLLELMAESGGSVIGLDWRTGLGDAWSRLPGRAVQGNLDPAAVLAPWSATSEQAIWVLNEARGRPGHIFNLGHGVLPTTEPDVLRRLVDLVHERTALAAVGGARP
jgi:uroporphyrinogen decarboxylase